MRHSGASTCHCWALVVATAMLVLPVARAADPQAYTVAIASTDDRPLDAALKAASQLESLQAAGAIAPFALVERAQQDVERLQTVLQGFGYYQGKVTITIDDRPLDDPGLPDQIESLPADKNASVAVAMEIGPLYRLRKVELEGEMPDSARATLGIHPGDRRERSARGQREPRPEPVARA